MTIQEYFDNLGDKELIEMCKECDSWKKTGKLEHATFSKFYEEIEHMQPDKRQAEDYLLSEAFERFKDIVPILLRRYPHEFIR